jgi:hypothetical protein
MANRDSHFLAVSCLLLLCSVPTNATAQTLTFRVGDRVLVSPSGLKGEQYWQQCTVIRELKENSYGVKCDPRAAGQIGLEYNVLPGWVKPLSRAQDHGAPPPPAKANVARDGTVSGDRSFVNCNVQQKKANNGDSIPPELAKLLVQCLWEKPSAPGMDGAQTVDIDSLDIGRPRKWVYQQDMGQGIANLDTRVWPIDVKWTSKTYYRTRTHVIVEEDIFNCYVDAFSKWSCGLGMHVKDISKRDVEVK